MPDHIKKAVILFDGLCRLCNGSVRFISRRDPKNRFNYIGLETEEGKNLLNQYRTNLKNIDSLILIFDDKIFTESTAVLTIARYLSGLWPLLYVLIIIPEILRDPAYKFIARKRHKWFRKREP